MTEKERQRQTAKAVWNEIRGDVQSELSDAIRYYRAVVVENRGDGKLTVRAANGRTVTVPCSEGLSDAAVNDTVLVLLMRNGGVYGDEVAISSADLQEFADTLAAGTKAAERVSEQTRKDLAAQYVDLRNMILANASSVFALDRSRNISNAVTEYYLSSSVSTLSDGEWSGAVSNREGYYLWTRLKLDYADGDTEYTTPMCLTASSREVRLVTQLFLATTHMLQLNEAEFDPGVWSTVLPPYDEGKYVWTRQRVTYADGTEEYTTPYCLHSATAGALRTVKTDLENLSVEFTNTSAQQAGQIGTLQQEIRTGTYLDESGTTQKFQYVADLQTGLANAQVDFDEYKTLTEGYIRSGIVAWEDGNPILGVAVGRDLQTQITDDGEVEILQRGFRSVFSDHDLSFWQDGVRVAYVSGGRLHILDENGDDLINAMDNRINTRVSVVEQRYITLDQKVDAIELTPGPAGPAGKDGADGAPGKDGTNGKDGTSSYVHIKYADVASPMDSQMTETPSAYIGICVDTNLTDPTTASSYTWSKWQGKDGTDGLPGAPGEDGTSTYVHFAYASSADGQEGFSTTPFDGALYFGVRTDTVEEDSTVYSDYAWSRLKGDKGDTGPAGKDGTDGTPGKDGTNGKDGTDGKDGTSSYVHIKYADVASPTDSQMTETPSAYIGICVDNNLADPTTASSYSWSKWQGKDGTDGIPGDPGKDGTSTYVHFAYASSADGQEGFSTTPFAGALYVGVRTDNTQADSTVYSDYAWSRLKGEDGVGFAEVAVEYYLSTSQDALVDGDWQEAPPVITPGTYLWSRNKITYTDGTVRYTDPVLDDIRTLIHEQNTTIDQQQNAILAAVKDAYVDKETMRELSSAVSTLRQTAEGFSVELEKRDRAISDGRAAQDDLASEIHKYLTFSESGVSMGSSDSPVKLHLDNDVLEFLKNNYPELWLEEDGVHAHSIYADKSFQLGRVGIMVTDDGGWAIGRV
jgi:hypothetical protein